MKFAALSSGSCGNCFYIKGRKGSFLIDCGISFKRVRESLLQLGENYKELKGIFITHEHTDHIKGIDVLARNLNLPIFATKGTIKNSFICSDEFLINKIKNDETFLFCGMEISSFSKSHDAIEPISFKIRDRGKVLSIITDLGVSCKNVSDVVNESDFLVIESNHDLKMLEQGPYPYFLKERIKSEKGHLSNLHSAVCVLENGRRKLKNIILSHLSETNNTPKIALDTFSGLIKERVDLKPKISVSWRNIPTRLFTI